MRWPGRVVDLYHGELSSAIPAEVSSFVQRSYPPKENPTFSRRQFSPMLYRGGMPSLVVAMARPGSLVQVSSSRHDPTSSSTVLDRRRPLPVA